MILVICSIIDEIGYTPLCRKHAEYLLDAMTLVLSELRHARLVYVF